MAAPSLVGYLTEALREAINPTYDMIRDSPLQRS